MKILVRRKALVEQMTSEELKDMLVISTTSDDPIMFNGEESDLLRLYFDDVDENSTGYECFDKTDAVAIKNFIKQKDLNKYKGIICSCDAGQSRSAAMAAALMYYLNGSDSDIFDNGMYTPNRKVYRTLLEELMTE